MALFGQSTAFGQAAPVAAPGGAFGQTLATAAALGAWACVQIAYAALRR